MYNNKCFTFRFKEIFQWKKIKIQGSSFQLKLFHFEIRKMNETQKGELTCPSSLFSWLASVCMLSRSVESDSATHGPRPTRLLWPCNFPGTNTGVGCRFLLKGIFPTQESSSHNRCPLHWQQDSLPLSHLGSPS